MKGKMKNQYRSEGIGFIKLPIFSFKIEEFVEIEVHYKFGIITIAIIFIDIIVIILLFHSK